jgi:hypothetical protein
MAFSSLQKQGSAGTNFFESDTDVYSGTISGSGKVVKKVTARSGCAA